VAFLINLLCDAKGEYLQKGKRSLGEKKYELLYSYYKEINFCDWGGSFCRRNAWD